MNWIKQNRWIIVVLPVVVIIALVAAIARRSVLPIRAEAVQREAIVNTISTNGKIEPVDNFQAHAITAAPVKRVLVKEGDAVRAGQLLVQLDDAEARAQAAKALAQMKGAEADLNALTLGGSHEEVLTNQSNLTKARAERDSAQRNLAALKKLEQNGSASAGEVAEADNRLKRAQAEMTLLEQRQSGRYSRPEVAKVQAQAQEARAAYAAAAELVHQANITAPRAGTVYSLPVRQGGFVNPGDLIVQVADLKKMQVRAFVDEPEIGKLNRGQKVALSWDAVPGRNWEGMVTRVPTTVIPRGTRNVGEIVAEVDNADLKLLPNVNVNVLITTAHEDNALTVSREAIFQDKNKRYAYVVHNGRLDRTEVQTGVSSLTRIQIIAGLKENMKVALGSVNSQPLFDDAPVKVVD